MSLSGSKQTEIVEIKHEWLKKKESAGGKADHRMSTVSFHKRTTHEPLRTLFLVGKILIYVNTDYHKLHFPPTPTSRQTAACVKDDTRM